jgi:hypothetical protein
MQSPCLFGVGFPASGPQVWTFTSCLLVMPVAPLPPLPRGRGGVLHPNRSVSSPPLPRGRGGRGVRSRDGADSITNLGNAVLARAVRMKSCQGRLTQRLGGKSIRTV